MWAGSVQVWSCVRIGGDTLHDFLQSKPKQTNHMYADFFLADLKRVLFWHVCSKFCWLYVHYGEVRWVHSILTLLYTLSITFELIPKWNFSHRYELNVGSFDFFYFWKFWLELVVPYVVGPTCLQVHLWLPLNIPCHWVDLFWLWKNLWIFPIFHFFQFFSHFCHWY